MNLISNKKLSRALVASLGALAFAAALSSSTTCRADDSAMNEDAMALSVADGCIQLCGHCMVYCRLPNNTATCTCETSVAGEARDQNNCFVQGGSWWQSTTSCPQ